MKHYLHRAGLFRPLLLMLMLLVGSGGARVWAEESTLSFTAQCKGSGTADDGVTWTVTSDGSESNFDGTKGIHYGTSKANVQYVSLSTSGISGTISKVVVNASTASGVTATVGVSIGGTVFGGAPKSLSTTATNYTFEGSASGDILVTVTKPSQSTGALYVKSVTVTYGNASSGLAASNLALTNAPVALTFDLYNNSSAQTVSFTTSSTGAVTVSGGTGYVTTAVSGKTITVTPTAVTPSAQTITVRQAADETYAAGTATFTVSVDDSTPFYGGDFTFDATSDKGTNGSGEGTITKDPVTMTCSSCNLKDGVAYRMYSGSTLTFTTGKGTITNIRFKAASGYYTNQLVLQGNNGMYDNATANQTEQSWVGSATSVSFKPSAQVRLTEIVVTVETGSSAQRTPTIVTINAAGITNTNRFTGTAAGSLSATVSAQTGVVENAAVTWSGNNNDVATIAADGTVTLVAAGSVAFTATYAGNDTYRGSSATYSMTVTNSDPNAPGTASNPYTVAQACAAIDAGSGTNEVYVRGIVCTGGSSLSSGALNYWISDDGTETNNFEIYRGKGIDGANFTSTSDIQKGDVVVVYGNLTKYNSTYEFSSGSQLISLTSKPEPELSFSAGSATAVLGQPFTGPTLDNPNNLTVTWNSMNTAVATVDATTGEVNLLAAGGTYIRAVFAGNDQYKAKTVSYELTVEDHTPRIVFDGQQNPLSETYTAGDTNIHYVASYLSDEVTLVLCDAEGNPATYDWFSATLNGDSYVAASWQANTDTQNSRTAYFYLQSGNTRSATFAFTQAVYVVDYATLPFSWDDTTTPFGITMDGVGTYNASPYLRFDDSGDYVILKLGENEVPGTLTFDITGDGFSGGTFSVQTARPGVTYSELKTYTELGGTKTTESIELGENVRYIKWVYTNKVSGNVALGNIHVGKHRTVISVLDGTNKTINVGQGGFGVSLPLVTNSGAPIQLTVDEENTTLSLNDFNLQQEDNSYHLSLSDDFFNKVKGSGVIVLKANAAAYGDYEAANEVTITVTVIGETFSAEDVNLAYDATSGQIAYSIENPVRYATLSAECDADWISDIQVADPSATSGTITFTTTPNEGTEPRTATIILKHQYSSYEKVVNVTVTQAGCEIDYETLPFSWEGGDKQDLQALNGVTANGLGSDYAANNNPYLVKLDGTGDYIQVKTDSQPGKVTIGVKMIGGGNTSTITVQESANGSTFTDVEALTISGAQNDVLSLETTNAFAADTRYVKILFSQRGSNVGVGPITITKYVAPTPAITPESTIVNLNAALHESAFVSLTYTLIDTNTSAPTVVFCDSEGGALTVDPDWISDAMVADDQLLFTVAANTGNGAPARTAYMKVQGTSTVDGATVSSPIITVTQEAPVSYTIALSETIANCEIYVFDINDQSEPLVNNGDQDPNSSATVLSGTTIGISFFADYGYFNPSLTVTDGDGQPVTLEGPDESEMYTFTLTSNVTIGATAVEGHTVNFFDEDIVNCTISVYTDPANPTTSALEHNDPVAPGSTVYVKATPDEGYGTPTITVLAGDTPVEVNYANGVYSFTADYDVDITATATALSESSTLPFNWGGGASADLTAQAGVTAYDLGSDYASNNSPYLVKLDGTGDYIQVKTDSQPGKVTIGVKMIGGGNTSNITVQESADGSTFTDVETLTISGSQNAVLSLETTESFAAETRYVRLLFTKGSNVGVGPITIAQYVAPTPAITPEATTVNLYAVSYESEVIKLTYNFINTETSAPTVVFCDANGDATTYDWISDATVADSMLLFNVAANTGNGAPARTAYMKVQGTSTVDGATVSSPIITVTQEAPVSYTIALSETIANCEIYVFDINDQSEPLVNNGDQDPNSSATVLSGTTIGISFFADYGYFNPSLTVTDGDGQPVTLEGPDESEMYTFTLTSNVTIGATAVEGHTVNFFDEDIVNCTISVYTDPANPTTSALEHNDPVAPGSTVYVEATPDDGYGTPTITVLAGDDELDLTYDEENSAYYFTLEYDVIISAVADEASFYTRTTTITSGKHYIIVGQKGNALYAMGGQTDNNRTAVSVELNGDRITSNSDVEEFVIYGPYADGNYAIYTEAGDGGYLYAASSSSNYLRTKDVKDANGSWKIEFNAETASIKAQGANTHNVMQFNSANSLFACYSSTSQGAVYLYEKENDVQSEEMAFLSEYGYSTLCCKNPLYFAADDEVSAWKVTAVQGENVTFERLIGIVPSGTGILLKGQGYGEVALTSARDVSNASIADVSGNLLVGVADPMTIQSGQYYGLYETAFRKLGAGTVPDNRAILPQAITPSGVKAFTFLFNTDVATGLETMENGQWPTDNAVIFNLNGQRLVKPQKGFNIINGKKVLVK